MHTLQATFNKYFILLLVLPFAVSFILVALLKKAPLEIFPEQHISSSPYFAGTYSDKADGGNSTTTQLQFGDTKCSYSYTLDSAGFDDPYAGVTFDFSGTGDTLTSIDVKGYTHLELNMTIRGTAQQDIYIKSFIDSLTTSSDRNTRGYARAQLSNTTGTFTTAIPLSTFQTPDWWYAQHGFTSINGPKKNLTKLLEINIQNSVTDNTINTPITVTVSSIRFTYSSKALSIKLAIATLLFIILLYLGKFYSMALSAKKDDSDAIVIAYNKVELSDDKHSEDVQRIAAFIAENYANAGLTVDILAKGAGVSAAKVPTMLKHKFQMNFKQYLNIVRISEAKRLLLETDQQIVTIAQSVGYNNIPHFNRTFKQLTGLSPKQFRKDPDTATPVHIPGLHPVEEE